MNFGEILQRTWQIIWRHKVLWLFGILAGCSTGAGGFGNTGMQMDNGEMSPFFNQFERVPEGQMILLVSLLVVVILILVLVGIFLGTMGRIALIRGTYQVESGSERLAFGELFQGSLPYFWRVFLLNLLVGITIGLAGVLLTLAVVFGSVITLGIGAICLVPLLCLLVPVAWFVNVILAQASVAIVVEDLGVLAGLERGWEVVRADLGNMILMALILLLGIGLIGGTVIGLPVGLAITPAIIAALGTGAAVGAGGMMITGLCLVFYLPVWLLLNGILQGYIYSAWTLTFLRSTKHSQPVAGVLE